MTEIKPYLLLFGDTYYPGRWSDFKGLFDTLDEALVAIPKPFDDRHEWYQVVDLRTCKVVVDAYEDDSFIREQKEKHKDIYDRT